MKFMAFIAARAAAARALRAVQAEDFASSSSGVPATGVLSMVARTCAPDPVRRA